jgi:hypothetical protein
MRSWWQDRTNLLHSPQYRDHFVRDVIDKDDIRLFTYCNLCGIVSLYGRWFAPTPREITLDVFDFAIGGPIASGLASRLGGCGGTIGLATLATHGRTRAVENRSSEDLGA